MKESISLFHQYLILLVLLLLLFPGCRNRLDKKSDPESKRAEMIERAARLELNYHFKTPPGDVLSHHSAGYAKIICSAVFITGLDLEFAMENVGYFTAPYAERARMGRPLVDYEKKTVSITIPGGITRTAVYTGDHGCVCLTEGMDTLFFKPVKVERNLPDPETTPWPMGDKTEPFPAFPEIDMDKVAQAVNVAFDPEETKTAAFLVTYRGKIIGERYADGINKYTPLESWSMGKSLTATLLGILINEGVYKLDQPAPVPQWQKEGDARSAIRIMDILHMSSGLHCRAPQDPDYDASLGYPDHLYLYTGGMNTFEWAAARPQQWPPNTVGRYRNVDPVLVNYLIRLGVEGRGEDYHMFPQKALFDKIGIRTMIMETDPYGNFLTQGYELASARDWARLGNLYLQDGIWKGERILPEGFTDFVRTPAPAWLADGRPVYGGFFWINGDGARPIPEDSYMMLGAGGQSVTIIPSHDMVIVRLGHYNGQEAGAEALNHAYLLLMEAVPGKDR